MDEDKQALLDSYKDLFEALDATGLVRLHDDGLIQTFLDYLRECPITFDFMREHGGLVLVFTFDQQEQPEIWRRHMGMCFAYQHKDGPTEYSIGISRQRIEAGREAALETWLHEAAHCFHGFDVTAHDLRFHQLNKILVDACKGTPAPAPRENILERLRAALRGRRSGSSSKG